MSCERCDALRAVSSSTSCSSTTSLEVGKKVAPRGRQVERVGPPVDGVAATLGEPSHLAAAEGQSQQALSNALGIHRSAVVALVDDLEQRGRRRLGGHVRGAPLEPTKLGTP